MSAEVISNAAEGQGTGPAGGADEVAASLERYRELADAMPIIVWTARPDGYLDYYNARWYAYTGTTPGEGGDPSWEPVLHPDDLQRCLDVWYEAVSTGAPYEIEYRFKKAATGEYRWHLGRADPVKDASGAVLRWYGTCTDIHDRKVAEAGLHDLNQTLEGRVAAATQERDRVWRYSADLLAVANADGFLEQCNPAWEQVLGWTQQEIQATPFGELIHPDDRERTMAEAGGLSEASRTLHFENRFRTKSGEYRWLAWTATAENRRLYCIGRDVTAEKAALIELRAILDSTLDAIITLNPSGSIESVNRAAEAMFGYGFADLERRDVGVLMDLAPKTEGGFVDRLARSGISLQDGAVREVGVSRRDGSTFPADVALSQMTLVDGHHVVAVVRDISERNRLEQLKSEFVSTVRHELRTPLTSISGALGLVDAGAAGEVPASAKKLITIAANNAKRLVQLINDILDIEKIESNQLMLAREPVELRSLLEHVVGDLSGYTDSLGVRIEMAPGEKVVVDGDPNRLTQVLVNLVSNAVKFSPPQAPVEVSVSTEGGMARIAVRDHGPGVPEAFRSRIFEKFAQADSSDRRQKGGTGLGLAIARELVLRQDGRLHSSSTPGEGATFYVDLPLPGEVLASPEAEPILSASSGPPAESDMAPRPDDESLPIVLHVEDDRDLATLVAAALEGSASVINVGTLAEARRYLLTRSPSLIILDLGLPDGRGDSLLPGLRSRPETVPVVLYSAQDIGKATQDAVASAFTKARSSLSELVRAVNDLLPAAAERGA